MHVGTHARKHALWSRRCIKCCDCIRFLIIVHSLPRHLAFLCLQQHSWGAAISRIWWMKFHVFYAAVLSVKALPSALSSPSVRFVLFHLLLGASSVSFMSGLFSFIRMWNLKRSIPSQTPEGERTVTPRCAHLSIFFLHPSTEIPEPAGRGESDGTTGQTVSCAVTLAWLLANGFVHVGRGCRAAFIQKPA